LGTTCINPYEKVHGSQVKNGTQKLELEPEPKEIFLAPQHWKQLNELMSQGLRMNWTIWWRRV
jgi:hypothetical protein